MITIAIKLLLIQDFFLDFFLSNFRGPNSSLNSGILRFNRKVSRFFIYFLIVSFIHFCHFCSQVLSYQTKAFLFRVYLSLLDSLQWIFQSGHLIIFHSFFLSSLSFSSSSSSSILPPWENS